MSGPSMREAYSRSEAELHTDHRIEKAGQVGGSVNKVI